VSISWAWICAPYRLSQFNIQYAAELQYKHHIVVVKKKINFYFGGTKSVEFVGRQQPVEIDGLLFLG